DETGGGPRVSGRLRVTVDASPAPTAEKLRSDLLGWLQAQKAEVKQASAPQALPGSEPRKAEQFTVRALVNEKPKEWTYILAKQGSRTVTLAANLADERADKLRGDLETIARSVEFLPKPR